MIIAAAVAVLLFCAVGIAAVMGWLPASTGGNARNGDLSAADQMAAAPAPSAVVAGTAPAAAYVEPSRTALAPLPARAPEPAPETAPVVAQVCNSCGVVESVSQVSNRAEGSGVGAAGGAVVGGLLGNQVGGGHGRQLATIAGAIGGAVAGNQIEGHVRATTTYTIRVRMENGNIRTLSQSSAPGWQSGDRVRVVNGQLRANG
jgi:outer membrane lipoprotein SlyB